MPSHPPCKVRLFAPVPAMFLVIRELAVPISIVIDSDIEFTTWPEVTDWRKLEPPPLTPLLSTEESETHALCSQALAP